MNLTIAIPVYNEEQVVVSTLRTLSTVLSKIPPHINYNIVVVNNGSTDNTKNKVLDAGIANVTLLNLSDKGKGLAVCSAARESDCDFFGFIDVDLSADPESIILMLDILVTKNADIVIGSRLLDTSKVNRSFSGVYTSKIFNLLQKFILGLEVKDTQCGLKLMNKDGLRLLRECKEKGWFFDIEFLYQATHDSLKIHEFPVSWEEFRYYKGRQRKLRVIKDGLSAIGAMFRVRRQSNIKNI